MFHVRHKAVYKHVSRTKIARSSFCAAGKRFWICTDQNVRLTNEPDMFHFPTTKQRES